MMNFINKNLKNLGKALNKLNPVHGWALFVLVCIVVLYYLFNTNLNTPDNVLLSTENSSNITNALFSEIKYNNPNSFISFGLRANHFSSSKEWFFEPRLFASTKISDSFSLKTSGEIKNQAVSQIIEYRNNGIGLENNIWATANNAIPILNSKQISIGFLYQNNGWIMYIKSIILT